MQDFTVAGMDQGIIDVNNKEYKYDFVVMGKYTDKSTNKIHSFTMNIGFEDDEAIKNQSPYAKLQYHNTDTGNGFDHIRDDQ